jgi:GT2 family glycosyltransferase
MARKAVGVIVHHGDPALTLAAVRSIAADHVRPETIVVVDNDPTALDDPAVHAAATILRPGTNIGFASAVNLAVAQEAARADFVWLLNNDATARPGAFRCLLAAMRSFEGNALVSSLVLDARNGDVWFERARFYPWRLESRHERYLHSPSGAIVVADSPSAKSLPYLPGCSLLVPTRLLRGVGGIDESFFLYGEDVDLSMKAIRSGWPLVLAADSCVDHRASSGTSAIRRERMQAEAALRLTLRYYPWMLPSALLGGTIYGLRRVWLHHEVWRVTQRWAGYADAIRRTALAVRRQQPAGARDVRG